MSVRILRSSIAGESIGRDDLEAGRAGMIDLYFRSAPIGHEPTSFLELSDDARRIPFGQTAAVVER